MRCNMSKATCFFQIVGQAIKNKIQQSYNFLEPPIWCSLKKKKKKNLQECPKTLGINFWADANNKEVNVAFGVKNGKWPKQVHRTNI